MTSFEATPNHSTAEEAARIALVAMHAALADELPRDWDGPYRISGDARSQPISQVIIDYLMRIAPKPVRLTGRWRADHMEIDLEVGIEDELDDDDRRSFEQAAHKALTDPLVLSSDGKVSIVGGNAHTTATLAGIMEFFLTYDLGNAFKVYPHRLEGDPRGAPFKALTFARGASSIRLIDL